MINKIYREYHCQKARKTMFRGAQSWQINKKFPSHKIFQCTIGFCILGEQREGR